MKLWVVGYVTLCAVDASDLTEFSLLTSPADPLLSGELRILTHKFGL